MSIRFIKILFQSKAIIFFKLRFNSLKLSSVSVFSTSYFFFLLKIWWTGSCVENLRIYLPILKMVPAYISNCIRRAYTLLSNSCIDIISIFYKITILQQHRLFSLQILNVGFNFYSITCMTMWNHQWFERCMLFIVM